MKRLQEVLRDVPDALRQRGVSHVLTAGTKYLRGRLPEELWSQVELCVDPVGEADEVISLFERDAIEVDYEGRNTLPRQLDEYNRRITAPVGNVYVFEDVSLVGSHPLVGVDNRYFSASWFDVETPFFTKQMGEMKRNLPLTTQLRSGSGSNDEFASGFLLLTERGAGFHHWFYEVLPKLWWYEELRGQTDATPALVCHSPLNRYQARSLELMGYDTDAVVQHPNSHSSVERLYVPPHPIRLKGNQLQALPSQLRWVGKRISANVGEAGQEFADHVYISRRDASRRRVTNEDELMAQLSRFGFERYEPGQLSFEDQVRLFAGADLVVGPHGKAYTNLIFAEDSTLIELFPENGGTETYFVACSELDLDYEFMECQPSDRVANIRSRDRDFRVPVSELTDIVEECV